ncbi:MAG: hypothetical protein GQ570_02485 [Helicobacteraceae bacterium]|nr:hypothetical protein [Helicobacteraceae bacterium]
MPKPSSDFKWTRRLNKIVYKYLLTNFSIEYLLKKENKSEIKEAFSEFFESYGHIVFQMKKSEIRLKVLPYQVKPENSSNLDAVVTLITEHDDLIKYDYEGKKNYISIQGKLRRLVYRYVDEIEDEVINKKELMKYAVRVALFLGDKDIIIYKKRQLLIKLFVKKPVESKKKEERKEDNTHASRYNGVDENELEAFYKSNFSKHEDRRFCNLVAKRFYDIYFSENKINFFMYDKNVFAYIQNIITELFMEEFDDNEEFFKGLSGYFFRIHFIDTFQYLSELILETILSNDEYIISFLKFYASDVTLYKGVKYKIPSIVAEDGKQWNVITMISIARNYLTAVKNIRIIEAKIKSIEINVSMLCLDDTFSSDYFQDYLKEKKEVSSAIGKASDDLREWKDILTQTENRDEKNSIQFKIDRLQTDLSDSVRKENFLEGRNIDAEIQASYLKYKEELFNLNEKLKRNNIALERNAVQYMPIKNSLQKALISKMKPIKN